MDQQQRGGGIVPHTPPAPSGDQHDNLARRGWWQKTSDKHDRPMAAICQLTQLGCT